MSTLNDLVASIVSSLHSYTGVQEQSTYLTASVTASDLLLPVANSDRVFRGLTEIDDELVYVDSSNSGALSVPPFGRGYRGSAAAAHTANTEVRFDPAFPRKEVTRAIDQCVAGFYPQLYAIKTADLPYQVITVGYDLPTDAEKILEVKAKFPGDPEDKWNKLYHWSFDPTSPEATGKTMNLLETLIPGSTIRVVYASRFGTFATGTDTLESVGLQESYADLILYGVTSRMVRFLDPARLQVQSQENLSRSQVVQVGDAGKIANQLYAMYQQRLIEERAKLLELYPPRLHFQE